MKFLWICDPTIYTQASQDVPTLYRHLSRDPRIEFFHAPIRSVVPGDRADVIPVPHDLTHAGFLTLDEHATQNHRLSDFDLVFCRRLKPFPAGYLDILSEWETYTKFVNSPTQKKDQMTPDFLYRVARDYLPDTLVTADLGSAQDFFVQHQTIVAKTANSCGGRGVFKIWFESDQFQVDNSLMGLQTFSTFAAVMTYLLSHTDEPLQFVRYLSQVTAGDKRIVVVDGEIYGAYIRRSRSGYWVNNVSFDGDCILSEVTPAEQQAIAGTVEQYRSRGLHTLGYDFLLDHDGVWRISEINAGNIGGFARLEQLTGEAIADRFLNWLINFASIRDRPQQLARIM
ncbi:hypothetical protein IQ266_00420 [filamentous cyanobacterium LEGE 11480]|uniref:Prokaryotic glutathione synthetase ATP-binding domain-containing protein n=1 Tax=Romeriopsis navalis LEGE 11480 TaxID=2777977 RepID=A0A928Z1P3_9CYAN|nr:hypothetical protein [Romeriopsis navalis]MBE9028217.1 hypothetical protein [Romeriopsis navalis LEGE 11480]